MLYELFVLNSLWFFAFLAVFAVVELAFAAFENWGGSLVSLLVFLGVLQFCTQANPWSAVHDNPGWIGVGVALHFILGVLWMVFKWRGKVLEVVERENEDNERGRNARVVAPQVGDYKEQIMGWMAFWEFSLLVWVGKDLLTDLYNRLYYSLAGKLQAMSDSLYAKHRKVGK